MDIKINSIVDGKYQILDKIGKGSQGTIYKVLDRSVSDIKALKIININEESFDKILNNLKSEFQLLKQLDHPNIIKVYNLNHNPSENLTYILMEYLEGSNLLESLKVSDEKTFIEYAYQILCGLHYLHSNNIIHFDIKPENIIITAKNKKPVLKILDFGMSELKLEKSNNHKIKGTINYIAPEFFIDSNNLNSKADLYSLGISLIHSFYKKNLLSSLSGTISSDRVIQKVNSYHDENIKLLEELSNSKIKSFIMNLIEVNPQLRISSAKEGIMLLNRIFSTKLKIPDENSKFSLQSNNKFFFHHKTVNKIIREFNNSKNNKFLIYGKNGSGKSKIANQLFLELNLNLQKSHIFNPESIQENTGFSLADNIVKQLSKHKKSVQYYELEIWKDLEKWRNSNSNSSQIFVTLLKFIENSTDSRTIFLLFNDVNKFDEISKRFIYYLLEKNTPDKIKFFFVLGFSKDDDKDFHKIKFYIKNYPLESIRINELTLEDVRSLTNEICGKIIREPKHFISSIYKYSHGNMKKILEIFDSLFSNEILTSAGGLTTFRSSENFTSVLKSNVEDKTRLFLEKLPENEKKILLILTLKFDALSLEEIDNLTFQNNFKTKNILKNFISEGLVSLIDIQNQKSYICDNPIVIEYFISSLKRKDIITCYEEMAGIVESKTKSGKYFLKLYKLFSSGQYINLTLKTRTDIIKKVAKDDEGFLLYNFLKILKKIDPQNQASILMDIDYISFLAYLNSLKAINLFKALEKRIINKVNINQIILANLYSLKIDLFDLVNFKYQLIRFAKKNLLFLHQNLSADDFYEKMIDLCYTILYANQKKKLKDFMNSVLSLLKDDISKHQDQKTKYFEFEAVFELIKSFYIEYNNETNYFPVIEKYLDFFLINKIYNENYFTVIHLYYMFAEKDKFRYNIAQRLLDTVSLAYKKNDVEKIIEMLNLLAVYYFNLEDYHKAYYFNQKLLEISNKFLVTPRSNIFGNLMTAKFMLYHPLSEILELLKEAKKQTFEHNNIQAYTHTLLNEFIILYRAGFFKRASEVFYEWFSMRNLYSDETLKNEIKRISVYFPEFLGEKEIFEYLESLLKSKDLSRKIYEEIIEILQPVYKEKICFRWCGEKLEEALDGELKSETPLAIINYIKQNKKLPDSKLFLDKVNRRYKNKDITGDYLIYTTVNYFLTNNSKMLDEIYSYNQKLFSDGYIINSLYNLLALLNFFYITRSKFAVIQKFIDLYKEIINYLKGNISEDQEEFFKQLYIFKTGYALVKKIKKNQKM